MKFLKIVLPAWGPFTDKVIDLTPQAQGVHLIYGDNEAGKTSCLRAIHNMFYRIPAHCDDNYLHENKNLRIGAELENRKGDTLLFHRRKGNKNTLLQEDGTALPDDALNTYIPVSLQEELFYAVFAFDHEILRRGGEQLAQGESDLGETLFAAGSGVSDLKQIQQELENEAGDLFKKSGRKPVLNELISNYKELQKEVRKLTVTGNAWKTQERNFRKLAKRKEDLQKDIELKKTDLERLKRYNNALPILSARSAALMRIEEFADLPDLHDGFSADRKAAQDALQRAETAKDEAEKAIGNLEEDQQSHSVQSELLPQADTISSYFQEAGSIRKARKDRSGLESDRTVAEKRCEQILKEIGRDISVDAAGKKTITTKISARISRLMNSWVECKQNLANARQRLEELEGELQQNKDEIKELPDARDAEDLAIVLKKARKKGNLESELKKHGIALERKKKKIDSVASALPLWEGELSELAGLTVPTGTTIEKYKTQYAEMIEILDKFENEIAESEEEIEELEDRLDNLKGEGEIPSEGALENTREERDSLWEKLKPVLLGKKKAPGKINDSVDEYETLTAGADRISDELRNDSERCAELNQVHAQLKKQGKKRSKAEKEKKKAETQKAALDKEWHGLWENAGIEPLSPEEMADWMKRQADLIELLEEYDFIDAEAKEAQQKLDTTRETLVAALNAFDSETDYSEIGFSDLLDHAEAVVERERKADNTRLNLEKTIAKAEKDLAKQNKTVDKAVAALDDWQDEWQEAIAAGGLDKDSQPQEAQEVLAKMEEFREQYNKMTMNATRLEAIDSDYKYFNERVCAVQKAVGFSWDNSDPLILIGELNTALIEAQQNKATLKQIEQQLEKENKKLANAEQEIVSAEEQLQNLLEEAGVSNIEECSELELRVEEARKLRREISDAENSLTGYCGGKTVKELALEVAQIDPDALVPQIEGLKQETHGIEEQFRKVNEDYIEAKLELDRMGGQAAAAEKQEESEYVASNIINTARHYAALKLASHILKGEIERFRDKHQGPMVTKASELFSHITCGNYDSLRTDYDKKDNPILLGVKKNGDPVRMEQMSDGTRDQLFLALRLAFINNYVTDNEPLPLVLDDILVNFDDTRSKNTLDILGDLSEQSQILLFTHHQHLVDMSKSVFGKDTLSIHELKA